MTDAGSSRKWPGLFIVLEGGDGGGKSTQSQLLRRRLEEAGREVILTREPGGTALGEQLREVILHPPSARAHPPAVELFLFLAARTQLVAEVIRPALAAGKVVVCDRFNDSTIAYQGYGRGLDVDAVKAAGVLAMSDVRPDLSVLLDLPVDVGLARNSHEDWDSIGHESREFHERVRAGFHALASATPERWLVVDATLPVDDVADAIWERVRRLAQ
jgi:dTMP kinase